jgi:hypothetical protein
MQPEIMAELVVMRESLTTHFERLSGILEDKTLTNDERDNLSRAKVGIEDAEGAIEEIEADALT